MPFRKFIFLSVLVALFIAVPEISFAQMHERGAFTQTYNNKTDSLSTADTSDRLVNFKEIFGGLAHKREMRIGSMFGTSLFLPGASQIYNKQYWKLPIFYTGIAAGLGAGITYHFKAEQTGRQDYRNISTWSFVGAGIMYYASLMDGAANYKSDRKPLPGRATIYSILLPGLGQAYNGEYWKIPIYVGGIVGSLHFYSVNRTNYTRFRNIYREACEPGYSGPISADQAKYYRDEYRRYRDYSLLVMGAFYLLQIIDANVFCYMHDFEVTENVAVRMAPTVILPDTAYASGQGPQSIAAGLSFGMRF